MVLRFVNFIERKRSCRFGGQIERAFDPEKNKNRRLVITLDPDESADKKKKKKNVERKFRLKTTLYIPFVDRQSHVLDGLFFGVGELFKARAVPK